MDFLGLKNLTIIEDTLARIYVLHNNLKIDLDKIPDDDKKTFELFQQALTTSVFQFESDGMKRYLKELVPSTFEDITAMVAFIARALCNLFQTILKENMATKQ